MANKKEVKSHIESISEIETLTSAMYMIASTKLRRAKTNLKYARACFSTLKEVMPAVTSGKEAAKSRYLREASAKKVGVVVITAARLLGEGSPFPVSAIRW